MLFKYHVTQIKLNRSIVGKSCISVYLWNGAEIEDALVAQAGQVGDNVRDVSQSISDQQVETGESRIQLLGLSKVLHMTCKLTPGLHRDTNGFRNVLFLRRHN